MKDVSPGEWKEKDAFHNSKEDSGDGERVHEVLRMMSLNLHITESGYILKAFCKIISLKLLFL